MELLIRLRTEARQNKDFAMADQIRNALSEIGITLEDRKGGTDWRHCSSSADQGAWLRVDHTWTIKMT